MNFQDNASISKVLRDFDGPIESRIRIHDSTQFEVKLDYMLQPDVPTTLYRIETYFFLPKSLGIHGYTYTRDHFYSDLQAYIRFKTPSVPIASLIDSSNEHSPLFRLKYLLAQPNTEQQHLNAIVYELKLLGCLTRTSLRDHLHEWMREHTKLIEHVGHLQALLEQLQQLLAEFRQCKSACHTKQCPDWVSEAFVYVDEYLSLTVDYHLTSLVESIDAQAQYHPNILNLRSFICAMIVQEQHYRKESHYRTLLDTEQHKKHFIHRSGQLKKFVTSVLFLNVKREKEGAAISNLVAAIAAGVAMLVATIAGVLSQKWYGLNSMPFIMALVVSYMLKDRLKDWLKVYFSSKMTRFLFDHNVQIEDPIHHFEIGRCREAFTFLSEKYVPEHVMQERHRYSTSMIERESKPEVVMKYEKDISLNSQAIARTHGRLREIHDIFRFNISHFIARTDDPSHWVRHYNADTNRVELVECPKSYHLNVVFVLRAQETGETFKMRRVRVVIDKRGIQRLEEV